MSIGFMVDVEQPMAVIGYPAATRFKKSVPDSPPSGVWPDTIEAFACPASEFGVVTVSP